MNEDYPRTPNCPGCGARPCECDSFPTLKRKRNAIPKCFKVCDFCGKKVADCKCEGGHELSKLVLKERKCL